MKKTISLLEKIGAKHADCYIAYARKSTDDADNQKNSIEYQEGEIRREVERQGIQLAPLTIEGFCTNGVIVEHHSGFKEDAEFSTNPDGTISISVERPKFLVLVNLLQQRRIKGVVALCWDRFSRNEADDMLTKKLLKQGADIRFVQVKYDTGSSGALHMDIDGMFSRHYSRTISEKVRNTNKKLREEGMCIYTPPLGYLSEGSSHKPFDPERAPIIKRIFEQYATGGWSFTALAQWATKHGLTTKPSRRKRTNEERLNGIPLGDIPKITRPVTAKTIEHILHNPFYIGKIRYRDELMESKAHKPLIDLATFYKVQAMMQKRNVSIHRPYLDFFTFRSLVKCGLCKRSYSPYIQKGITYYRVRCKPGCTNALKNISDGYITQKVGDLLGRIHFTNTEIGQLEEYAAKEFQTLTEKRNKQADDIRYLRNKEADNLAYLEQDRLTLLRTGVFTAAQLLEEEARLKTLIRGYEEKVQDLSQSMQTMLEHVISFSELLQHVGFYFSHALDSMKRNLVIQVFSELYIENGELKYVANEACRMLLERHNTSNKEACWQATFILELERIYQLIKHDKLAFQYMVNHCVLPRAA